MSGRRGTPVTMEVDTVRAPAPVAGWSLALTPTLPGQAQHHLFERSLRDPNKFADTLARLEALLGPNRLGTPRPRNTHQPDSFDLRDSGLGIRNPSSHTPPRRSDVQTEAPPPPTPRHEAPIPTSAPALPLKRYRPAIEIHVASELRGPHHYPLALLSGPHRGPIAKAHGPFPLSGHWWDPGERWRRVEWDLQLSNRTLLRLVYEVPHRWLLEGAYE